MDKLDPTGHYWIGVHRQTANVIHRKWFLREHFVIPKGNSWLKSITATFVENINKSRRKSRVEPTKSKNIKNKKKKRRILRKTSMNQPSNQVTDFNMEKVLDPTGMYWIVIDLRAQNQIESRTKISSHGHYPEGSSRSARSNWNVLNVPVLQTCLQCELLASPFLIFPHNTHTHTH